MLGQQVTAILNFVFSKGNSSCWVSKTEKQSCNVWKEVETVSVHKGQSVLALL